MHASIRKYKTDSPAKVTRLVNEEFVPRIKKLPGFLAYYRRRDFGFCQRFRDEGQSGGIQ
jgi:hypothetical protein